MKTTFKLLALVMALVMMFCLVACGNDSTTTEPSTDPSIVPSTGATEPSTAPTDDGKVTYTVIVKDSNGNPVAGVDAQICKDSTCYLPVTTDENGVATWRLKEASDYYGSVSGDEEGISKVYFEDKFEVTVVWDAPAAE